LKGYSVRGSEPTYILTDGSLQQWIELSPVVSSGRAYTSSNFKAGVYTVILVGVRCLVDCMYQSVYLCREGNSRGIGLNLRGNGQD
jgi:hypothetical protein